MERQPPAGPGGGEPFPSFDPDFTPAQQARGPAPQARSPRPQPRAPAPQQTPPRQRVPRSGGRPPRSSGDQPNPWLVGAAVASVLAALSIITFGVFGGESTTAGTTLTTATTVPGTETTIPDDGSTTTLPDDGSSTTTPGQTTIPTTGGDTITPIGDAILLSDIKMAASALGPLEFGQDSDEVLGRLAATYGQPTDDTGFFVGDGTFGECPGDSVRVVRWGPLNIVSVGEEGSADFVSYRLDLRYGGITSPTTDIATLSGLRVGDTVGDLESIYSGFAIEYVVDEGVGGLTFELRENQAGDILLWGPVDSQAPEALVTGIYSKDFCETADPDPDA